MKLLPSLLFSQLVFAQENLTVEELLAMPLQEITKRLTAWFHYADTDKDNILSRTELSSWLNQAILHMTVAGSDDDFGTLDENLDDKISQEEFLTFKNEEDPSLSEADFLASLKEKFSLADKDKNGFLDKKELALLSNPVLDPQVLDFELKMVFKEQDSDSDGKISLQEYLKQMDTVEEFKSLGEEDMAALMKEAEKHFNEIDKDGSGFLEMEDLVKHFSSSHTEFIEETLNEMMSIAKEGENGVGLETLLNKTEIWAVSPALDRGEMLRSPSVYAFDPAFPFGDWDSAEHHDEL